MVEIASNPAGPRDSAAIAPRKSHVGWIVLGCVVAMAVTQSVSRQFNTRLRPGPERGDLVLQEDSLPAMVDGWRQTNFVPAPETSALPPDQYWWVHCWTYSSAAGSAVVTFDQLGERNWHELSHCYHNGGWEIVTRTIEKEAATGWPYAVCVLRKPGGMHAALVFSLFYEDGSGCLPPDVDLARLNSTGSGNRTTEALADRMDPIVQYQDVFDLHDRVLQSQVLLSTPAAPETEQVQACIRLHLRVREQLRQHWMQRHALEGAILTP